MELMPLQSSVVRCCRSVRELDDLRQFSQHRDLQDTLAGIVGNHLFRRPQLM